MVIFLLSCGTAEVETPVELEPAPIPQMDAVSLLTRASLDLRGVRPTVEEIEQVEADPEAVEVLIDGFLDDERFGERVLSLWSTVYLTRQDSWSVTAAQFGLDDQPGFSRSVGEQPLRMLERIAVEDRPYPEIVTAEWTMADETLEAIWPLERQEGEGWQPAVWTDERPEVGVLSSNTFWWRYMSNASNANRGRANAVSKVLLCTDYLTKPISFQRDVNLLDAEAVDDALKENPGCVSCHHSLDPLSSYLWGFYFLDYRSPWDISEYHPERELFWQEFTGVQPGYYGTPGQDMSDLGQQLAQDPRLPQCFVEQSLELLLARESRLEDTAEMTRLREVFLAEDLRVKPLIRAVVDSPQYRAGDTDEPGYVPVKLLGTDLLASSVEDLTGFRFTYLGYDMLSTDTYGLRTLAGGVDGNFVTSPATDPTTTMVLVQERLAQAAAQHAVETDRLFPHVDFGETPATDREAMVEQIQFLHLRVLGQRVAADGPEVEANLALWEDLYAIDADAPAAWTGVLTVLLRDPLFLTY